MMRFAVYDEAKKFVHPGESDRDMLNLRNTHPHTLGPGPPPAWKMALAGSIAGGVAGVLGNPAELMMVRMQADKAKPIESEPVDHSPSLAVPELGLRTLQLPKLDTRALPNDQGGGLQILGKRSRAERHEVNPHEHVPAGQVS